MQFLAGWIALAAGCINLLRPKGTGSHKAFGYLFMLGMGLVGLDAAIAVLQRDRFDLYVGAAAVGFAATVWAVLPFIDRRPGWLHRHAHRMQAAAIALCAAAGNALLPKFDTGQHGGLAAAAMTLAIVAAGFGLTRLQRGEIERVAAEMA